MRAVALLAGRTVRIILGSQLAVGADLELLPHFRVAGRAIDFLRDRLARSHMGYTDFRMALAA